MHSNYSIKWPTTDLLRDIHLNADLHGGIRKLGNGNLYSIQSPVGVGKSPVEFFSSANLANISSFLLAIATLIGRTIFIIPLSKSLPRGH